MIVGLFLLWLAAINGLTWYAFYSDKRAAVAGHDRWPEKTLLMLALVGGTPAAFHARATLRHKTRKQPFGTLLYGVAAIQILLLLALMTPDGREAVTGLFWRIVDA